MRNKREIITNRKSYKIIPVGSDGYVRIEIQRTIGYSSYLAVVKDTMEEIGRVISKHQKEAKNKLCKYCNQERWIGNGETCCGEF